MSALSKDVAGLPLVVGVPRVLSTSLADSTARTTTVATISSSGSDHQIGTLTASSKRLWPRRAHWLAMSGFPTIHPWPDGADFAFVPTHDVETADGMQRIERIANLEEDLGFRSSWNIVPHKYPVDLGLAERSSVPRI